MGYAMLDKDSRDRMDVLHRVVKHSLAAQGLATWGVYRSVGPHMTYQDAEAVLTALNKVRDGLGEISEEIGELMEYLPNDVDDIPF